MACLEPYEPINTLKPVAEDLWIVDGPIIRMRYFGMPFAIPFSTRMTIVRLPGGALWLHSPTEPTDALLEQIAGLGEVRYLIAPNKLHFWWLKDWAERFFEAQVFVAPGVAKQAGERTPAAARVLGPTPPAEWQDCLDQVLVRGSFMSEVAFFHRPSRTAILVDLVQSFEEQKVRCRTFWWMVGFAGCAAPDGGTPLDLRATFWPRLGEVRGEIRRIVAWEPERVIIAHGRWIPSHGAAALRQSLRWAL